MKTAVLLVSIFAHVVRIKSCTWTFNDSCYTLVQSEQEFFHAQAQCDVNYGATLASITSQEEDDFLRARLEDYYGNIHPCGDVSHSSSSYCNGVSDCFCSSDVCLTSLSNGNNCYEGNVFVEGRSICDDSWDLDDANVVCRQLGFRGALEGKYESYFGEVEDNFILDDVHCVGDEADIRDCPHSDSENCGTMEGAGVICNDAFGIWIGGLIDFDEWVWVNGDTWGYTNWGVGQPSGNARAMEIYWLKENEEYWRWGNDDTNSRKYFICESSL